MIDLKPVFFFNRIKPEFVIEFFSVFKYTKIYGKKGFIHCIKIFNYEKVFLDV